MPPLFAIMIPSIRKNITKETARCIPSAILNKANAIIFLIISKKALPFYR